MSRFFAGFLFALSLVILLLEITSKKPASATLVLWLVVGGFSVYKLCQKPSRAA